MKQLLWLAFFLSLAGCSGDGGGWFSESTCEKPKGTKITDDGHYLKGPMVVPLGNGESTEIMLHTQWEKKSEKGRWEGELITEYASTGQTPCETHVEVTAMWQEFFQDMIDRGMPPKIVKNYADGIRNPDNTPERANAGVYVEQHLGACGYAGRPGTIHCVPVATTDVKQYYVSHESTHAFQWDFSYDFPSESTMLYRVFAAYANYLYHLDKTNPELFKSEGVWSIDLSDYALQNPDEWFAEVFRDYLYYTPGFHFAFMEANAPERATFFDCIWLEGNTFSTCQAAHNVPTVGLPQVVPINNLPTVQGFSQAESEAIWDVCFQTNSKASNTETFNNLISRLTSGAYTNTADYYKLGYGDCNHDGVIDWVCSYQGFAPDGGAYLWNSNNQVGAYTFVASGKIGDGYADYRQDPYFEEKGTLLKPIYSQWQGTYGSCNGSLSFNIVPERFPIISESVTNLPSEIVDKTDW